jgi:predicted nucleic acid-binding protein
VIVVDTSAWVEFLRGTDSPVCEAVDQLLASDIAICDVISMELLAGARDERHLGQLRGLVARATMLPTTSSDYGFAASMYRACRVRGETVRKLIDCLIAAVAVRSDLEVLHADADFSTLARHTDLRIHASSLQ